MFSVVLLIIHAYEPFVCWNCPAFYVAALPLKMHLPTWFDWSIEDNACFKCGGGVLCALKWFNSKLSHLIFGLIWHDFS